MVGDQIQAIGSSALDSEVEVIREGNISEPTFELGIFLGCCSFRREIKLPK